MSEQISLSFEVKILGFKVQCGCPFERVNITESCSLGAKTLIVSEQIRLFVKV